MDRTGIFITLTVHVELNLSLNDITFVIAWSALTLKAASLSEFVSSRNAPERRSGPFQFKASRIVLYLPQRVSSKNNSVDC